MSSSLRPGPQSPWRPDYIRKLQLELEPYDLSLIDNKFCSGFALRIEIKRATSFSYVVDSRRQHAERANSIRKEDRRALDALSLLPALHAIAFPATTMSLPGQAIQANLRGCER